MVHIDAITICYNFSKLNLYRNNNVIGIGTGLDVENAVIDSNHKFYIFQTLWQKTPLRTVFKSMSEIAQ